MLLSRLRQHGAHDTDRTRARAADVREGLRPPVQALGQGQQDDRVEFGGRDLRREGADGGQGVGGGPPGAEGTP